MRNNTTPVQGAKTVTFPNFSQLSQRQSRAVLALMQQPTVAASAQAAGVTAMTVFRWLRDPKFCRVYRNARYAVMNEAFTLLQKASTHASETIIAMMRDQAQSPGVRLRAATMLMEMAVRSRVVDELEARIAVLEQSVDEEP